MGKFNGKIHAEFTPPKTWKLEKTLSFAMNDVHFYVVTEDTWDKFKERFTKENGDLLFYALSVRDYETIALNMAELKRYIDQQKQVIIYYEKAVKPKDKKEDKDGKIQR